MAVSQQKGLVALRQLALFAFKKAVHGVLVVWKGPSYDYLLFPAFFVMIF